MKGITFTVKLSDIKDRKRFAPSVKVIPSKKVYIRNNQPNPNK